MGTRGLLGHIIRGKRNGAYNHFDSYPAGLGIELAKFINSLSDEEVQRMIEMVDKLEWVRERDPVPQELQDCYVALGFADLGVGSQRPDDCGELTHLVDSTESEQNALSCEWTYFVDWEKKEVHVHSTGSAIDETCIFDRLNEAWMNELQHRFHVDQGNVSDDETEDEHDASGVD